MQYGCIGEKLGHSYSKEIHAYLADYEYELCEIPRERLSGFLEKRDFRAINVTIPYKEAVIPHLYFIDEAAKEIGAVNTVVNRGGRLYGYNTDFFGMRCLILRSGAEICGKKALVLGSGGTSKTAVAVLRDLGAGEIFVVSRSAAEGQISYDEAYSGHSDARVIVNTTPVGMYPKVSEVPVDISKFPNLTAVFDAVYNPARTNLVSEAKKRGIIAESGLYMLVAQAARACEIFTDTTLPRGKIDQVFGILSEKKQNIVLCGMPGAGKTTIGKLICQSCSREFYDTDILIREKTGSEIPEIFKKYGEEHFRNIESEVIAEVSKKSGVVIATGGGAMLREENVRSLARNGKIVFLDAPIDDLLATGDRPLSNTREKLEALYAARYGIYCDVCDIRVEITRDAEDNAKRVLEAFSAALK